jgi:hypothetical protein
MRLTLRTLLAYLDDTLGPVETREIGLKVAENPQAQELVDRIKRVTRRRGLATPPAGDGATSDPNTVADYLSDSLTPEQVAEFEKICLESDVHLAEVAACHQILTLLLSEQVRVPPSARRRMYQLVKGRESQPNRQPGNTIPVGGAPPSEAPPAADDADAPLLLGMSAYSRSDTGARRAMWALALGLLLVGFAVAVWMALPPADPARPLDPPTLASVSATQPTAAAVPPQPQPQPKPKPKVEDAKPAPPPPPGEPLELVEAPRPAGVELVPDQDLGPKIPPPSPDRVVIGRLEKPAAVVVRKQPGDETWARVLPEEPDVISTDRLICLPGFRGTLRLEGAVVDLWGNLPPELLPIPILESSVTPHQPPGGFDADLTVHVGRVYVTTKRPTGATVRLRVKDQVWDVALADDKAELVVEVAHELVPGAAAEPPRTYAVLAVLAGQATLKQRYKPAVVLPKGGNAYWDSKAGPLVVRAKADEKDREIQAQFLARLQPYPDAERAKAALEALTEFATRLVDAKRVRAVFAEALQERPDAIPTRKDVSAARVAVFAFGAMADVNGLSDGLTDPRRPLIRQTAVQAVQSALALDPSLATPFRQALVDKAGVGDADADTVMRLLRGLAGRDRTDPAMLDRLAAGLRSPAVCVRELSFQALATYLDPADRSKENVALYSFDAGAPKEYLDPQVRAWEKKVEELKKKIEELQMKK